MGDTIQFSTIKASLRIMPEFYISRRKSIFYMEIKIALKQLKVVAIVEQESRVGRDQMGTAKF